MKRRTWVFLALLVVLVLCTRVIVQRLGNGPYPSFEPVLKEGGADTLVVALHGFNAGPSREGLLSLVRTTYPDADLIAPLYTPSPVPRFSNLNPYQMTEELEASIDRAYRQRKYARIVLVGHSMGAIILRKAIVWASGYEEDRPNAPARRGRREWVDRIERFVSLAGINRGWAVHHSDCRPSLTRVATTNLGIRMLRWTNSGRLILSLERGAPFVADLRVQWIRMARGADAKTLPPVIHLLGTCDDIVTSEDSRDINAAPGVQFVSLSNTSHGEIAHALAQELPGGRPQTHRARAIIEAMTLPFDQIQVDQVDRPKEDRSVKQVVYVMHGIRDYAPWARELARAIETTAVKEGRAGVRAIAAPYGWFPMLPFLLYGDRQEHVRWFMDQYTEHVARFPFAEVDYIGHSNGTYILAAALQRYKSLRVRHVYFAGSVVPSRYSWLPFLDASRVHQVRNVVATHDWVVALFPRLYEQLAEWTGETSLTGYLDIGAAGFRGFRDAAGSAHRLVDLEFTSGYHGAGVDTAVQNKRDALVYFALNGPNNGEGDRRLDAAFKNASAPSGVLNFFSNISWLAWLLIITAVLYIGWRLRLRLTKLASRRLWSPRRAIWTRRIALTVYALVIVGLLNSL
jgi:pimeloyl-ACP methyl ester carboxylesterase